MTKRKSVPILFLLFTIIFQISTESADQIVIDDFTGPELAPGWSVESFAGMTEYTLTRDNDIPCLKAVSRRAASGLVYRINIDPQLYPVISWSWKIDRVLAKGDARTKAGDDYAARLYVIFPSVLFWRTKVLNYVWANQLPRGAAMPNAFTGNAMMVAVESGNGKAGQWVHEQRNILEDYQKYFGSSPGKVGAIAIMTDTDNTGEEAAACYGPIRLQSTLKPTSD